MRADVTGPILRVVTVDSRVFDNSISPEIVKEVVLLFRRLSFLKDIIDNAGVIIRDKKAFFAHAHHIGRPSIYSAVLQKARHKSLYRYSFLTLITLYPLFRDRFRRAVESYQKNSSLKLRHCRLRIKRLKGQRRAVSAKPIVGGRHVVAIDLLCAFAELSIA